MCLSGSEKSCSVCRLQAGELQLPVGPEPGTGSDEGLCNGPLALSWCRCLLQLGAPRATHHLADGAILAAAALGAPPVPLGTQPPLPRSGLDGLVQSPAPAFPQPGPPPAAPSWDCAVCPQHRAPAAPRWLFLHSSLLVPPSPKFNFFPFP